jgi:pyrimidine-specific ribonucleoside hydrolase
VDLVLDVDTGVDDALAILFAARHPDVEVRAITCVTGNVAVDQVVANTLKVLDAAGASEIPIAGGCSRPLLEPVAGGRSVHGLDGLADLGMPPSSRRPADVHAVEALRSTLATAPRPVVLVTLAPLTNIALLLRTYPNATKAIERMVVMGGVAQPETVGRWVDFNVAADPEAAAIVFNSGLPITMYGLDVFFDVTVTAADGERLVASEDPAARLAGRLILHQAGRFGPDAATLGDAGALMAALAPDGLRTMRASVDVDLAGPTRGRTHVDAEPPAGPPDDSRDRTRYMDVAGSVDSARFRDLFLSVLEPGSRKREPTPGG